MFGQEKPSGAKRRRMWVRLFFAGTVLIYVLYWLWYLQFVRPREWSDYLAGLVVAVFGAALIVLIACVYRNFVDDKVKDLSK